MGTIGVLEPDEIEDLLRTALVGRIACCAHGAEGDGRPYIVPLSYGYDGESVYAFSWIGRKIRMMRQQPLVTFEVDEAIAEDRWRSVIADGEYEELTDPEDQQRLREVMFPDGNVPELKPGVIYYRLRLSQKSGRYELPEDEA